MPTAHPFSPLARAIRTTARKNPAGWAYACGIDLRPYQLKPLQAIARSILNGSGLSFVVMFPRQSGKDESQLQLFGWLMLRAAGTGGTIISVAPTFKPQTITAMERFKTMLQSNAATRNAWSSAAGFIFRLGRSRIQFFSGEEDAKVVGATASLLLSVNEAQDISPRKYIKDFEPMVASTNATRVFWGTRWTTDTLLELQHRQALDLQRKDHIQRVFILTADDVARVVPAYKLHVRAMVKHYGRQHPLIKTQYFSELIDADATLFNPARMALLTHAQRIPAPAPARPYAFLIDVAGSDELDPDPTGLGNPGRDFTQLSIAEIDLSTVPTLKAPRYRIAQRFSWHGTDHVTIAGAIESHAATWRPQHIIVDATGLGEGLATLLLRRYGDRVTPLKYTPQLKSEQGWTFLAIIDSGRFMDCTGDETAAEQYRSVIGSVLPGPSKLLRWGVPDGKRSLTTGQLIHDDIVVADSMVAHLDALSWTSFTPTLIVHAKDVLDDMSHFKSSPD